MCTPWTIRDWARCFFSCRFPLDEEPGTFCSSSAQVPGGTMAFNKSHSMTKMASKCNQERESVPSSTQSSHKRLEEKDADDPSWPRFADEDYIVFCFCEDGAIHVVREGKKPEPSDYVDRVDRSSTRRANPKIVCGEHAEEIYSISNDSMLNEDERVVYITNKADSSISNNQGKGKRKINFEPALPSGGFRGENDIDETKECEVALSAGSSDSNQSDGSSSSFAFPVLSWEGVGSPEQMPKPDPLQLRMHKARAVRLHCCRF